MKSCGQTIAALGGAILFTLSGASSVLAGYRAVGGITQNVGGSFVPIDSYDHSGIVDAGGQVNYDEYPDPTFLSYHAQADSEAGGGVLRAHAFSEIIKNYTSSSGFTLSQTASSAAYAVFDDIVITGPASPATIPVSFNFHLSGGHIVISTDTPGNSTSASSTGQAVILVNNTNIGGGYQDALTVDGGDATYENSGILSGFTGNNTLTSPVFNAPVNTPFTIELQLSAFAGVSMYYTESCIVSANCDFGNTMSFATTGDVFNLPDGYTVNSAQANIVDNTFIPEPAGAVAALAMMGVGMTRRLSRRPGRLEDSPATADAA